MIKEVISDYPEQANPRMKPIIPYSHEVRILGVVGAVMGKRRYR